MSDKDSRNVTDGIEIEDIDDGIRIEDFDPKENNVADDSSVDDSPEEEQQLPETDEDKISSMEDQPAEEPDDNSDQGEQEPDPQEDDSEIDEQTAENNLPSVQGEALELTAEDDAFEELDTTEKQAEAADTENADTEPLSDEQKDELWNKLKQQIERELEYLGDSDDNKNSQLLFSLGEICEFKLGEMERALLYYQQSFAKNPAHIPTLKAATRMFKEVGRWDMVIDLLDATFEIADDNRQKSAILIEKAEILFTRIKEVDQARESLDQALEIDPESRVALKLLENINTASGNKTAQLDFYNKYAFDTNFAAIQLPLLQNLAQYQAEKDELQQEAIDTYQTIIHLDPSNLLAISALKRLLVKHKKWDELSEIYELESNTTDDSNRKAVIKYLQARINADHQNNPDMASELLSQGLEIDPDNVLLLDELESLFASGGEYAKLVDVHIRQFEQTREVGKQVELAFKIGGIYQEHLADFGEAAEWYEKALEAKHDYLPALHVLGKLYSKSGNMQKLTDILKREAECIEDEKLKAAKYFSLAEHAQNKLEDDEQAVAYHEKVLELMPGYLPAVKALSELFAKLDRIENLIEMNEQQIELSTNMNIEQFIYLLEKNATYWKSLDNYDKAADCHKRILEKRREYLPSIQALGMLHAQSERWKDLIEINQIEADLINDQHRIVSLLFKNGELYEHKLEDIDQAVGYYNLVLTLSPAYIPAVKALGNIYQNQERWDELIKMYQREIESVGSEEQATSIRFKIGQIYDDPINNSQKAETYYRKTLESSPEFTPALHSLTRLLQRQEKFDSLIDVYEGQVERNTDESLKLLALYKIAELYESKMDDLEMAEETYKRILSIDTRNMAARRGLFRIYSVTNNGTDQLELIGPELEEQLEPEGKLPLLTTAADIYNELGGHENESIEVFQQILNINPDNNIAFLQLEQLILGQHKYEDLALLYAAKLERLQSEEEKLSLLWIMVDLFENHLDDFERLHECYSEIIRIEPFNMRALNFFEDQYVSEKQWEELLDVYQRKLQSDENRELALQLSISSAQIYEFELNQPRRAIELYREALRLDRSSFVATQGAKRIYTRLLMWSELVAVLENELQQKPQSISVEYQLGFIQENKFSNIDIATEHYLQVLEKDPIHKEAFIRARKLLDKSADFETLVKIYLAKLAATESEEEKIELHRKVSELAENQLSDLELATKQRRKLLELLPEDPQEKRKLADLLVKGDKFKEAIDLYESILPLMDEAHELKELNFIVGDLYQTKLNEHSQAISSFETVLAHDPDDMQAMERLGELYKKLRLSEEALEMLAKLLEFELPREKEIRCNLMIGEITLEQLDKEEESLEYFEKALALDPNNKELLDTLSGIFEKRNDWERLVKMYTDNIELQLEDNKENALQLLIGLASIYSDNIKDIEKALETLAEASQIDPQNSKVNELEARVLAMDEKYYEKAIGKYRELIKQSPFEVTYYRELLRIFSEQQNIDAAFCAMSALDFLKDLKDEQLLKYKQQKELVTGGIASVISEEDQKNLLMHMDERGVLEKILATLEPTLYKLAPADIEPYDLPSCKQAGVNSSVFHLMENASYHLGVDLFSLYISNNQPDICETISTKPPTAVLGGNLAFASEGIKRFLSGMLISRIKHNHVLYIAQPAEKLRFWVECACQLYIPELEVNDHTIDEIQEFTTLLNKTISKSTRKELEELSREYHKLSSKPDFKQHMKTMQHTDNRMGLLFAGDMTAAAEFLVYTETGKPYRSGISTEDVKAKFEDNRQIRELLAFTVSEDYFKLRQIININVD